MIRIGEKIRQARESQNLSKKKLAELLNVDVSTICLWESNKRIPTGSLLLRIIKFFKFDIYTINEPKEETNNVPTTNISVQQ